MSEKSETRIVNTRIVNAPIHTVWKIWTEPEHLNRWWGPHGFTSTTESFDFKEGGKWSFTMHSPDGQNFKNVWEYTKIQKPTLILMKHTTGPVFDSEISFEDLGGRTKVVFKMNCTEKVYDMIKDFAIQGNEEHLDEMEMELGRLTGMTLPKEFVVSRTFNAPVDTMWKLWTDPAMMAKWWGPKGAVIGKSEMDLRRGGFYHYSMVFNQSEHWGKWFIRDVVTEKRLTSISCFSNKDGEIVRHPMNPVWPKEIRSTLTLEPKAGGKTEVTIRWYPVNATEEEIKAFNEARDSMTGGWGGTLDQLQEIVTSL